jgi:hypothetical protein
MGKTRRSKALRSKPAVLVEVKRMSVTWYRQTQTGWKTIGVFLLLLAFIAAAVLFLQRIGAPGEARRTAWGLAAALLVVVVTNRMEVKVTDREVFVRWGWLIGKHIPFSGIDRIERERIPWTRVGMKFTNGVSWFSVSTGPALRFRLKNGKSVVVGTADPDGLLRVLQPLKPDLFKEKGEKPA